MLLSSACSSLLFLPCFIFHVQVILFSDEIKLHGFGLSLCDKYLIIYFC